VPSQNYRARMNINFGNDVHTCPVVGRAGG
jgi:hypothetical protein